MESRQEVNYSAELVWAKHPDILRPMRMSRGMLSKKHRLGWRELTGENHEEKESFKKEDNEVFKEIDKGEKSNGYKQLISEGIIRSSEHG